VWDRGCLKNYKFLFGITNPISAYFVLSDDAQDEIGEGKRKS